MGPTPRSPAAPPCRAGRISVLPSLVLPNNKANHLTVWPMQACPNPSPAARISSVARSATPPPPATNIAAAFRLGAAFARPQLQSVPQGFGLIENALWTITADIDATLAQHATARADFLLECAPNARQNPHLTKHTSVLYFHTALISTGCFSATGACQSDAQICRGPILPGPNPVRKMITRLSLPPKAPVPTMPPRLLTNPEHHPITR